MFNFNNLSPLNYVILFYFNIFLIDQLIVVYVYGI